MADPRDPRFQSQQYMEENKIQELFEALTAHILFYKPENPRTEACKYLERVKVAGTPVLLNDTDLSTMFSMFDITNRGVITSEQADNALKSLLGPEATLQTVGIEKGRYLKVDEFVSCMTKALEQAAPYTR